MSSCSFVDTNPTFSAEEGGDILDCLVSITPPGDAIILLGRVITRVTSNRARQDLLDLMKKTKASRLGDDGPQYVLEAVKGDINPEAIVRKGSKLWQEIEDFEGL